jgi:heat shock protein HtpX
VGGALAPLRNLLKIWGLLLALCAVFGAIGYWIGGVRLGSILVFSALLLGVGMWSVAERVVMGLVGARELPFVEAPALHSATERLAARAGVAKPKLYLVESGPPLALAGGRGIRGSAVAVTGALLALPAPAEIEALVAHEIAHLRNRDVLVQTAAVVVAAALVDLSRIGGWLERTLLFVLGPLAAAFAHLLLSPKREFEADRLAAELCDSPHALADALIRLEQAAELVEFRASPATEPLYTINPFVEEGLAALFDTHPPVGERVRRLRALDPDWKTKLRAA